jgi:hypothetical protein
MANILFVEKKLRNSHIVWLQKSNMYIILKNPAYDILRFISQNSAPVAIYNHLDKTYNFPLNYSKKLVSGLKSEILKINKPSSRLSRNKIYSDCTKLSFVPVSTRYYNFGNKLFSVSFENIYLENWFHPMFSHLEITDNSKSQYHFEIFRCKENIVFRENYIGKDINVDNKSIQDIEKIFLNLANIFFDKSEKDLFMTVHAAAITNKNKTILLTASSGSGKTTLAALMLQKQFQLVSDDFVVIDKQYLAYSFPSALSIKHGALNTLLNVHPELADKTEYQVTYEKKVRYLAKGNYDNYQSEIYPVNEILFVEYNPKIDFKLTRVSRFKAIKAFLEQAYINPEPECAEIFLSWALKASFYKLTYSDAGMAQDAIVKLFNDEK